MNTIIVAILVLSLLGLAVLSLLGATRVVAKGFVGVVVLGTAISMMPRIDSGLDAAWPLLRGWLALVVIALCGVALLRGWWNYRMRMQSARRSFPREESSQKRRLDPEL